AEELQAPDYYSLLRGYVAGGYITGSLASWKRFIPLFYSEIQKLLEIKRAPSEEQIIPQIMHKNPDLFEVYYGDYDGILSNYYLQRLSMSITNYNLRMCLERGMWHRVRHICERVDGSDLKNDAEYQRLVATRPKVNLIVVTPVFIGWSAYPGVHGVIVINSPEDKVVSGDKLCVYQRGEDIKSVEMFGQPMDRTFILRLDSGMSVCEVKEWPSETVKSYWVKCRFMEDIFELQHRIFRADYKDADGPKH